MDSSPWIRAATYVRLGKQKRSRQPAIDEVGPTRSSAPGHRAYAQLLPTHRPRWRRHRRRRRILLLRRPRGTLVRTAASGLEWQPRPPPGTRPGGTVVGGFLAGPGIVSSRMSGGRCAWADDVATVSADRLRMPALGTGSRLTVTVLLAVGVWGFGRFAAGLGRVQTRGLDEPPAFRASFVRSRLWSDCGSRSV